MRRRNRKRRHPLKDEMALQITSMADIFTILLVFLLKSFSTGVTSLAPGDNLILPEAHAEDEITEGTTVEISPTNILIDGKPVANMQEFAFEKTDTEDNGTSRSLNIALIRERENQEKKQRSPQATGAPTAQPEAAGQPAAPTRPKLIVMADQKTPYRTLKSVMTSAANTGFGDFKLIVVEDR